MRAKANAIVASMASDFIVSCQSSCDLLTHVKELPLVIAGEQRQREIANRAKKILAAKQRDRGANTNGLERQIDRLVDEFYVLTSAEGPLEQHSITPQESGHAAAIDFCRGRRRIG